MFRESGLIPRRENRFFFDRVTTNSAAHPSRQGHEVSLFSKMFIPPLGLTQPSGQQIPGIFQEEKQPGPDVDHSLPSRAEVKNERS
jgi:hypothetical protein